MTPLVKMNKFGDEAGQHQRLKFSTKLIYIFQRPTLSTSVYEEEFYFFEENLNLVKVRNCIFCFKIQPDHFCTRRKFGICMKLLRDQLCIIQQSRVLAKYVLFESFRLNYRITEHVIFLQKPSPLLVNDLSELRRDDRIVSPASSAGETDSNKVSLVFCMIIVLSFADFGAV